MRKLTVISSVMVLVLAGHSGCRRDTSEEAERARREISEAADASADYLENKKQEYEEAVARELAEIDGKIEALKAKAAEAKGDVKERYQATLDTLGERRAQVRSRFEDIRAKAPEAFADLREGVDAALADLKSAFQKAKASFEDKEEDENRDDK